MPRIPVRTQPVQAPINNNCFLGILIPFCSTARLLVNTDILRTNATKSSEPSERQVTSTAPILPFSGSTLAAKAKPTLAKSFSPNSQIGSTPPSLKKPAVSFSPPAKPSRANNSVSTTPRRDNRDLLTLTIKKTTRHPRALIC